MNPNTYYLFEENFQLVISTVKVKASKLTDNPGLKTEGVVKKIVSNEMEYNSLLTKFFGSY
jgi:hypothetical protein